MKKLLFICIIAVMITTACGNSDIKELNNITTTKTEVKSSEVLDEETSIKETVIGENISEDLTLDESITEVATTSPIVTIQPNTEAPTTEDQTTQQPTTQQSATVSNEQILKSSFTDLGDSKLNDMCDEILVSILNADMAEQEKAYAIYTWVCEHIRYRGTTAITDWKEGAKVALSNRKGNCYAFYVSSRALLARAGFETEMATSYELDHYWNLVKVDGTWRHFDTTSGWGAERFLWTGTQINEYTYYNPALGTNITYNWNPEGCPNTD